MSQNKRDLAGLIPCALLEIAPAVSLACLLAILEEFRAVWEMMPGTTFGREKSFRCLFSLSPA